MNITFLIGNGFDLGIGLNTGYENFYDEYSKIQATDNTNILSFKTMLDNRNMLEGSKIIDWSDFEKAFGQHSTDFVIRDKLDYIERFEDFVASFNTYLENEEKHLDFSDTALIAKTMNTAVTTYFHIRTADRDFVQGLYNSDGSKRIYNFISFNYTKSVDKCAHILKQHISSDSSRDVGKILHIHGFIEENMIMGVNDASQIINEDFAKDEDVVREIVKPQQNSDVRANYEKQVIDTINGSNIICVYGMSIGETDKKWWSAIAKWLVQSERHVLVILKYDKNYNKRFPFVQNRFIDSVTNRFLALSEQSEEVQSKIRSRVFVGMNHNVFGMPLCKKKKKAEHLIEQNESIEKALTFASNNEDVIAKAFEVAEKATELAVK